MARNYLLKTGYSGKDYFIIATFRCLWKINCENSGFAKLIYGNFVVNSNKRQAMCRDWRKMDANTFLFQNLRLFKSKVLRWFWTDAVHVKEDLQMSKLEKEEIGHFFIALAHVC